MRPYVLPSQVQFATPEAHMVAAGPKKWNRQQGFYIYRARRLLVAGGWLRLFQKEEHCKLARVRIDGVSPRFMLRLTLRI